jgi:hypothetical protein
MDTLTKESAMAELNSLPPLAHLKLEDMRMKDLRYRDHLIEIIAKDVADRTYIVQRDSLIPRACKMANMNTGFTADQGNGRWSVEFLRIMDLLWRKEFGGKHANP